MYPMKQILLFYRPDQSHHTLVVVLSFCNQNTEEQKWRQQICKMKRDISVLQAVLQDQSEGTTLIFWPDQTKMVKSIWFPPKLLEFWAEWKAYVPLVSKFPNLFGINAILHEHYPRGMLTEGRSPGLRCLDDTKVYPNGVGQSLSWLTLL